MGTTSSQGYRVGPKGEGRGRGGEKTNLNKGARGEVTGGSKCGAEGGGGNLKSISLDCGTLKDPGEELTLGQRCQRGVKVLNSIVRAGEKWGVVSMSGL